MTQRAVIWVAVSSQEQAGENKISLEEQERLCREWCAEQGFDVVDLLAVPGYSRSESDIITALEEFARQGVYAYHQLREMWQQHSFDVLVAFHHDRLGRSTTLHSWVIENVILSGARIYLIQGGWINPDDFRFQIAMGGYTAASDNDRRVKNYKAGARKLAQRGLPAGRNLASHIIVRDSAGRAIKRVVDPAKRRMFDDLADLLLEGTPWSEISARLYDRGHAREDGRPLSHSALRTMIYSPTFWGHTGIHTRSEKYGQNVGCWAFDPDEPPPAHAHIWYNTHEPVYTGEQADRVKAELRRRRTIRGSARTSTTYRFNRLLVCGECGYHLNINGEVNKFYVCWSRYRQHEGRPNCPQSSVRVPMQKIQDYLDALIRQAIILSDPDVLFTHTQPRDYTSELVALDSEIASTETRIRRLIHHAAEAGEALSGFYREEIQNAQQVHQRLQAHKVELQAKQASVEDYELRSRTLEQLDMDTFWQQPDRVINQTLHRLVGDRRFVMLNGEIIGTVDAPRHYRQR